MYDEGFDPRFRVGVHIPLTCVNHPHLRWSTKNIGCIGARNIFFDLFNEATEPECACSGRDLRILTDEELAREKHIES